ncbi:MAG TPA: aldo/keto reductase [Acidobacteriaceae bacterium]|nr:aldo/keto reductase [Acidobacteriaceae bacterium]
MLETIALPGSGRVTTRLGFGGSGLMGGLSERESLRLLETAFDAGIRHFDVAPAYGHGRSERCLGKFLQVKRDQITVATKYGILPPARAGLLEMARRVVRPAVARLPAVRSRVAKAAAGLRSKAKFSEEEARRSLDQSRRELGVERIDVWLLHEATADDLDGSDLLPLLQDAQRRGWVGTFGVGAECARLPDLWKRHRNYCPVLQFEWSGLAEEEVSFPGAFLIHHRAISGAFGPLRRFLEQDSDLCRQWSNAVDLDLSDSKLLAGVLLQAALAANTGGMVLFSSRVPEHILANVHAAEEADAGARGRRFLELVAEKRSEIRSQEKS